MKQTAYALESVHGMARSEINVLVLCAVIVPNGMRINFPGELKELTHRQLMVISFAVSADTSQI